MKVCYFLLMLCVINFSAKAQVPYNAAVPNGYTKKAFVAEQVGLTEVTVRYHRPAVKGREGKIWGTTVPIGFVDQGFGTSKSAPWRAGANENTVIEFDTDVKIEGQLLSRGKYGFFVAYDPAESTIIFSKNTDAWGSFFYDEKQDALRVKVKPRPLDKSVENLKYEFTDQTLNSAVLLLSWEKLSIPFKIEVDYNAQQFRAFLSESQRPNGFTSQGLNIAAAWTLQNNYELEKGLEWANMATANNFPGDPTSFSALSTKAGILDKLGRGSEAESVIRTAMTYGNMNQLQQLGRQLITSKQPKIAMEVFEFNYSKNPTQFAAAVGMVRGLSATADYKKAREFAAKALLLAPNDAGKQAVRTMIDKLDAGKDVN